MINNETFPYFALNPQSNLLTQEQKTQALTFSVIMGIFTLGIGHLVCKIICDVRDRNFKAIEPKMVSYFKDLGFHCSSIKEGTEELLINADTVAQRVRNLGKRLRQQPQKLQEFMSFQSELTSPVPFLPYFSKIVDEKPFLIRNAANILGT